MKIYQGFLFIGLSLCLFVALCIANDCMFPKRAHHEIAWYGELHFDTNDLMDNFYKKYPEFRPTYDENPGNDDNDNSDDSPDED